MKHGTIQIQVSQGGSKPYTKEIPAFIVDLPGPVGGPLFGVHRKNGDPAETECSITHIPSGMRLPTHGLAPMATKRDLIRVAERLAELDTDWLGLTGANAPDARVGGKRGPKLGAVIMDVVREEVFGTK